MAKVPVQKGSVNPNPQTSKQMTHSQKVQERADQLKLLRSAQTCTLSTPKN